MFWFDQRVYSDYTNAHCPNESMFAPSAGELCELQHQLEDQPVHDVQRSQRGSPQRSEWSSTAHSISALEIQTLVSVLKGSRV